MKSLSVKRSVHMITILWWPEIFARSNNNLVFQVESDNANIVYFRVKVYDADTTTLIAQNDYQTTPQTPTGSYFNLSKLLSFVVNWEVNNNSSMLVAPLHKFVRAYQIKIIERVVNNPTGTIEDGDVYDEPTDINYVWEAQLSRIIAAGHYQIRYVINSAATVSFLTQKPNHTKVNDISCEQL